MDPINYIDIIPNEILCMITAYLPAHYLYIFIKMVCKDLAEQLAGLIHSDDKPLKKLCNMAAKDGHLEVLKWARENGCEWNSNTCANAAENGHLEVLKWARENGCEWNSNTCAYAAQNGHLEVLKWARENGCKWNSETCTYAAQNGHLEVLKWARENGCK